MLRKLICVGACALAALTGTASAGGGAEATPTLYKSTALRLIPSATDAESDKITLRGAVEPSKTGVPGVSSAAVAEYTSANPEIGWTSVATWVFNTESAARSRYGSLCALCPEETYHGWYFKTNTSTGAMTALCRNVIVGAWRKDATVDVFPKLKTLVEGVFAHATALGMTRCDVLAVGQTRPVKPSSPKPSSVPRLARLYVKTYHPNLHKAFIVSFKGKYQPCGKAPKIRVVLKSTGFRYSQSTRWCKDDILGEANTWHEGGDFFYNPNDLVDNTTLALEPNPDAFVYATQPEYRRTIDFGYWVTIGGRLARSGRLQVSVKHHVRTIWSGEDEFINYCINETKRLWSSGGRLHCFRDEFNSSMKLLR